MLAETISLHFSDSSENGRKWFPLARKSIFLLVKIWSFFKNSPPLISVMVFTKRKISEQKKTFSLARKSVSTSPALQIRASQRSITANLWPLTARIYHVMIIVISGFSKKSFFLILFFISKEFFWTILNSLFHNHCVLAFPTFSNFSTACKHTGWVCSLFACSFAITLCNNTLHFLYWDRFIKTNP